VGAHNVVAALALAPGKIPARARVTLVVMSVTSLDRAYGHNRPQLYFGGATGVLDTLAQPHTDANIRHVREDIATLAALGIVEPIGYVNRRRCYRLRLGIDNPQPVDNSW
jgi:hypothetical protein